MVLVAGVGRKSPFPYKPVPHRRHSGMNIEPPGTGELAIEPRVAILFICVPPEQRRREGANVGGHQP